MIENVTVGDVLRCTNNICMAGISTFILIKDELYEIVDIENGYYTLKNLNTTNLGIPSITVDYTIMEESFEFYKTYRFNENEVVVNFHTDMTLSEINDPQTYSTMSYEED